MAAPRSRGALGLTVVLPEHLATYGCFGRPSKGERVDCSVAADVKAIFARDQALEVMQTTHHVGAVNEERLARISFKAV